MSKQQRFGRPSPALVVSLIALFVALGGTSYAAFSLPKNSVGTAQLKTGAVTGSKLKAGLTVPDSMQLAGHPFGYFLPARASAVNALRLAGYRVGHFLPRSGTAADSTLLAGHAAGYFLPATATAANSLLFAGYSTGYFLPASGTAANSSQLGGHSVGYFLPASGTAANSSELGGYSAAYFLPANGTAANASLLGGFPASYFLPATGTAADSKMLGGYPAATYFRLRAGPLGNTSTGVDSGSVGQYGSVTIGSDGLPIVSYYDQGNQRLKVLHCGTSDCSSGNTATVVDSSVTVAGQFTSIAVGADGLPVISYAATGGLRLAHCGNVACTSGNTVTIVDASSGVGEDTSVTIGADGLPLISYYDHTNGDLKVAHCGNPTCGSGNTVTSVDTAGNVGRETSVALGADGLPVISYVDLVNGWLKVLHCGNGACNSGNTTTTVDSSSCCDNGNSTTIGADGLPLISFFQGSVYHMVVLHCGNVSCSSGNTSTTVGVGNNDAGAGTVTVGADGLPMIAYYTISHDLDVLHCGDVSCNAGNVVTTLETDSNNVGGYASVSIGADGLPLLLVYDAYNGALKTIHCADTFCVPYFRRR